MPRPPSPPAPASPLVRTYLGLFDDKLAQYDAHRITRRDNVVKGIVRDALFGGEGYLNDGYLLLNPVCQEAIVGDRSHPLRALLELGQVRLLSNSDDIERSLRLRAESRVTDFARFFDGERWPEVKKKLPALARRLQDQGFITPWPTGLDLGSGFAALIAKLAAPGVTAADLGLRKVDIIQVRRIVERFVRSMEGDTRAARTRWEAMCAEQLGLTPGTARCTRSAAMRELMLLGNAAYHYNFGVALGAASGGSICVETVHADCFDELLDVPRLDASGLGMPKRMSLPNVASLTDGIALDSFLTLHGPAKQRFMADYEAYLDRRLDRDSFDGAIDGYSELLGRHFGARAKVEDSLRFKSGLAVVVFAAGVAAEAALPGLNLPMWAKVGGAAVGFLTENFGLPHVMRQLALRRIAEPARRGLRRESQALQRQLQRSRTIASVLDASKVQQMRPAYRPFVPG